MSRYICVRNVLAYNEILTGSIVEHKINRVKKMRKTFVKIVVRRFHSTAKCNTKIGIFFWWFEMLFKQKKPVPLSMHTAHAHIQLHTKFLVVTSTFPVVGLCSLCFSPPSLYFASYDGMKNKTHKTCERNQCTNLCTLTAPSTY